MPCGCSPISLASQCHNFSLPDSTCHPWYCLLCLALIQAILKPSGLVLSNPLTSLHMHSRRHRPGHFLLRWLQEPPYWSSCTQPPSSAPSPHNSDHLKMQFELQVSPRPPLVVVPRLWRPLDEDDVVQSWLLGEKDLGGAEAGTLGAKCPGAAQSWSFRNLGQISNSQWGPPTINNLYTFPRAAENAWIPDIVWKRLTLSLNLCISWACPVACQALELNLWGGEGTGDCAQSPGQWLTRACPQIETLSKAEVTKP